MPSPYSRCHRHLRATAVLMLAACATAVGVASRAPTSQLAGAGSLAATVIAAAPSTKLSGDDLEELLAPIALYADPLLASVLAASVYTQEVQDAWKAVQGGATTATIDASSWEDPVKSVAKAPEVIKLLGQNMDWTTALGEAYVVQAKDVMDAVQRLRARAQANGALQTTPQQVVSTQGDTIIIQSAQPNVVYVPTYSPAVVYAAPSTGSVVAAGVIGFGVGLAIGCAVNCDWHSGGVCWGGGWGGHNDVNVNINNNNNVNINNNNTNINNIGNGNRPGREGGQWQPDRSKMSPSMAKGDTGALDRFQGASKGGQGASKIPGMGANSQPISSRPAPRPSTSNVAGNAGGAKASNLARPSAQPLDRPQSANAATRPAQSGNAARPSIPTPNMGGSNVVGAGAGQSNAARPSAPKQNVARPTAGGSSKPSAYGGSRGGGGNAAAQQRGSSSRASAGGGNRGGGGARGGGGRGR